MKKTEIIAKTLKEIGLHSPETQPPYSEGREEEDFIISVIQERLPDVDIGTCEDFKHLAVECCETCHTFYPHYDMSLIELPDGGKAWVCDNMREAIYPDKYRTLRERSKNSADGELLSEILGEAMDK